MKMMFLNQVEMFKELFSKMQQNGVFKVGAIAGITIQIPQWIYSEKITHYHAILMGILVTILVLDFIVGFYLAKQSPTKKRSSTTLFNAFVKNFVIIAICSLGYGIDYLLGTKTFIFSALTAAFALQNSYSLAANIYVAGWFPNYPVWLFEWARDEIELKKEKYFPTKKEKD